MIHSKIFIAVCLISGIACGTASYAENIKNIYTNEWQLEEVPIESITSGTNKSMVGIPTPQKNSETMYLEDGTSFQVYLSAESPRCNKKFNYKGSEAYQLNKHIQQKVGFDIKKNWLWTYNKCDVLQINEKQYFTVHELSRPSRVALFLIYDPVNKNAFGIYRDVTIGYNDFRYYKNKDFTYKTAWAKLPSQNSNLEDYLTVYVKGIDKLREQWLEESRQLSEKR